MSRAVVMFISICVLALAVSNISAQTTDTEQVRVGTNLVNVGVSVTDRKGKHVGGIGKEQFQIFDNGTPQEIAFFSTEESPTMIGIVYDMHPSTVERSRAMLTALQQFVKTLRPNDRFFIVAFNEYGSLVLDFVPTLEQVQTHLTPFSTSGPNSLYDAVFLATGKIRESPLPKRALLVISDGEDHNSQRSYAVVRDRIRGFNVQIYAVTLPVLVNGLSDRWQFEDLTGDGRRRFLLERAEASLGRAVLDELARVTGGTAYPESRSGQELTAVCTQIAMEMQRQYSLGFYPTEGQPTDKPHKLTVTLRPVNRAQRDLSVSYRRSYEFPVQR